MSFSDDGIDLTVTAGTFRYRGNPAIDFDRRDVSLGRSGLGSDGRLGFGQIDGFIGNDVLALAFSEEIMLESISFGRVDGNDDFAFGRVTSGDFIRFVNFEDVSPTVLASDFLAADQRIGNAFGIGAIGWNDNFTVTSLTVSRVIANPIPASGILLGCVLLGAGALRMRRTGTAVAA